MFRSFSNVTVWVCPSIFRVHSWLTWAGASTPWSWCKCLCTHSNILFFQKFQATCKNSGHGVNFRTYTLNFNGHFPGEPGLAGSPLILPVHLFLDCTSFLDRPKLSKSFLTQSHQVFLGRPLCLIPSTSASDVIQRMTQSWSSFCSTCPNHLNLLFLIIKLTGSNPKSSLSSSIFRRDASICKTRISDGNVSGRLAGWLSVTAGIVSKRLNLS